MARHRELNAHDDVDRPSPSVQVLDTKWVFYLKINTTIGMIERFKTCIVADGQPQILGFDCSDVHSSTIQMPEIKLLLGICAYHDMELFQMDTTTAFISAALKPSEIIVAILHPVWTLDLVPIVFLVFGKCWLHLKALVLLQ